MVTRHAFSFGPHYDPAWTGVGPLVALNEELLDPGSGYDEHRHATVDVVTWVAAGEVVHSDLLSGERVLRAGCLGVLRSGSGVVHAERCAPGAPGPARFLQAWLLGSAGNEPSYDVLDVRSAAAADGLVLAAAGPGGPDAPLRLTAPAAVLRVGTLLGGARLLLPQPAHLLALVRGELVCSSRHAGACRLAAGDALELATADAEVEAGPGGAEFLLWSLPERGEAPPPGGAQH